MAYKDHASMSYIKLTGRVNHSQGYDNNIITEHNIGSHDTSLTFYVYAHFYGGLYLAFTCKLNAMP